MKLLKDILYKAGISDVLGTTDIEISSVTSDSREARQGTVFVARKGVSVDGHEYINAAAEQGAAAIVCEEFPQAIRQGVTYVKVKDSAHALGIIASNFHGSPSDHLELVGVTGTNGKTTTTTLLYRLFRTLGYKCGLISTVEIRVNDELMPATHTTPDPVRLNAVLAMMVREGCEFCFMEVSSHAVDQKRISGLNYKGAVFTNITHDHLDYHKTFDEYLKAKKRFFDDLPEDAFALFNNDDRNGRFMVQETRATISSYGLKGMADHKCRVLENNLNGLLLNIDGHEVLCKLIGAFNAYNILTVYSAAVLLGEDPIDTLAAISGLDAVEGRFQYIRSKSEVAGIVDYAHTPDALKNVLSAIGDIRSGNEQLITVVGCGGDRDSLKRPLMAAIASERSDRVILTSDNPRTEDPIKIIDDMKKGVEPQYSKKVLVIPDRQEAIKAACSMADPGDIILVAGKGHEKYQEVNGVKHPFDDMQVLQDSFKIYES